MLWSDTPLTSLVLNEKRKTQGTFRFQLPDSLCTSGLSEYGQITLETSPEFAAWFEKLEQHVGRPDPWKSVMSDTQITLKIDEWTQIFDENKNLDLGTRALGKFQGCTIKCIVEIVGMYYFREMYGLTCRVYQVTSSDICLFN
jgi:hypothetical protein